MSQTLQQVLIDLVLSGADRGALVRAAQDGKSAAVCVIMADEAILEIAPALREIFAELGSTPAGDFAQPFTETIGLKALFEIGDAAPCGWSYGMIKFGVFDFMVAVITREVERVAQICNANRAPCSLDPNKPAPGWNITGRKQRG